MWLLLSTLASAGPPPQAIPEPPALLADLQLTFADSTPSEKLVMRGVGVWTGRSLGDDPGKHSDPTHTGLTPELTEGKGTVAWLVGHRLSERLDPGDTIVTYALIIEVPPTGTEIKALLYRDSGEIPRSYAWGTGEIVRAIKKHTADRVEITVKDTEYGDAITITGLLRGVEPKATEPIAP